MTYDRIFFIILITLPLCKGQIVFRNNEGYDFTEPLKRLQSIVNLMIVLLANTIIQQTLRKTIIYLFKYLYHQALLMLLLLLK